MYFPVFLLGFYYNDYKNKLETEYSRYVEQFKKHNKLIAIAAAIFIVAVTLSMPSTTPFLFKSGYGNKLLSGFVKRVLILICEVLVILLFNRFMTNKQCILTKWGVNSMSVYILHYFIIIVMQPTFRQLPKHNIKFLPVVFILAFCITFVLSRNFVGVYMNKFTDFFYNILVEPLRLVEAGDS